MVTKTTKESFRKIKKTVERIVLLLKKGERLQVMLKKALFFT